LVAGWRRIEEICFPVTASFRGKFKTFQIDLALVVVMKVDASIMVHLVVNFGDIRRWSEPEAPGVCPNKLQFSITNTMIYGFFGIDKFDNLLD
jgi:hypothetical protein